MDLTSIAGGLVTNAIWWVITLVCIALMILIRRMSPMLRALPEARRIHAQGIRRFLFSRHEYPERLDKYLDRAKSSIKIVSISLRVTNDECKLTELFWRKLAADASFEIHISLLSPGSVAVALAADALNISREILSREIEDMLADLKKLRDSLPESERLRFHLLTHDSMPLGSAIMLDATVETGIIQVETKLYRAPRVESFSFEIVGGSPFYKRNYIAWNAIIAASSRI